jgi:hypothetical protein
MTKRPYAKDHPFVSGETVTPGSYRCAACGRTLKVERVTNLPVCPACQHEEWHAGEAGSAPSPS